MALRWMDNFQNYGTDVSLMTDGIYATQAISSLVTDPDPEISTRVLQIFNNQDAIALRKVLPSEHATVGMCMRTYHPQLPTNIAYPPIMVWRNAGNGIILCIRITTTGALEVRRGAYEAGTLLVTSDPVIVTGAWQHIEAKAVIDSSAGSIEVRVDGVPVIDESSINTGSGTVAQVSIDQHSISTSLAKTYYVKDFAVWDGSGSFNNDFLGTGQVITMAPDGDVSFNWGASTGTTGYNLINEAVPDDDSSYIYADDTPPAASTFSLEDLPPDVTSVKAIMPLVRSKKTDGGDGNLQVGIVSNGTPGLGADRPITPTYTFWYDVFETDPDTGAAWLPAAVDAAILQLNRTT